MVNVKESTVPENATLQTGSENDWMQNEAKYQVTMRIILQWLNDGLITSDEYELINKKFKTKYRPKIGDLMFEKAG